MSKIMQVERRSKACFDYPETQLIFGIYIKDNASREEKQSLLWLSKDAAYLRYSCQR